MKLLSRFKLNTIKEQPQVHCPGCWGRQEYDGLVFDPIYKEKINLNNLSFKKGWILAYAQQYLEGLKTRQRGTTNLCPSCHLTYHQI